MSQHRSAEKKSRRSVTLGDDGLVPTSVLPVMTATSAVVSVEVDLGSTPVYSTSVTVTAAACEPTFNVLVSPSAEPATGRGSDDNLWDGLILSAVAGTGEFTLHVMAVPGPVSGKRMVNYQFGT
jgi:hypothetical protein